MKEDTKKIYTPQKWRDCILFAFRLTKCGICEKDMVTLPSNKNNICPNWTQNSFDDQARRAGLVIKSTIIVDSHYICCDCEKAGLADFKCCLCKKRKPTSKIKEIFGDPEEFLCFDCYETVTAKIWEEEKERLIDEHRYDYC